MVLARNTYRFALLLVGYGIASGIDDLGAHSAEGPALIGLGLGGVALLCGTLAGYARGPERGHGGTARERDGPDDRGDGSGHDDRHGDDVTGEGGDDPDDGDAESESVSGQHVPWGWY